MPDKKIIDKQNVKENNPNDDEEVLKNNDDVLDSKIADEPDKPKNKDVKTQDPDTPGIA